MKIVKKSNIINKITHNLKNIGFVPTMGALHEGHASLIKLSKKKTNKTIVSIFVNPKQFNKKKDYNTYPNKIKQDLTLCKKLKVDYVFLPNTKEVYNWNSSISKQPKIKNIMEEKFRKGHFDGVLKVMSQLLSIVNCTKVFMGKKDYQQLILIKELIKLNKLKTKLVECKTVRIKNGAALSSRNLLLESHEIYLMGKVAKILKNYKKQLKKIRFNSNFIKNKIYNLGIKNIDYVELIKLNTLSKVKKISNKTNIFIAYYIRNIRLIDNI